MLYTCILCVPLPTLPDMSCRIAGFAGERSSQGVVSLPLGCVRLHDTACSSSSYSTSDGDSYTNACRKEAAETCQRLQQDLAGLAQQLQTAAAERDARQEQAQHPPAPKWFCNRAGVCDDGDSEGQEQQPFRFELVLTGGTATTAAALLQGCVDGYDGDVVHMSCVTADQLMHLAERAAAGGLHAGRGHLAVPPSPQEHTQHGPDQPQHGGTWPAWVSANRARSLAAGCVALAEVMGALGREHGTVSDRDLLDALLHQTERETVGGASV